MAFVLKPDYRHDTVVFKPLMEQRAVNWLGPGCLKQFRRIATRYEKLAENYLAMLGISSVLLWL